MESLTFELHCTLIMISAGIFAHSKEENLVFGHVGGGHSAIYGPYGRRLTKSLPADQERVHLRRAAHGCASENAALCRPGGTLLETRIALTGG
jgi:hypothetical protein